MIQSHRRDRRQKSGNRFIIKGGGEGKLRARITRNTRGETKRKGEEREAARQKTERKFIM